MSETLEQLLVRLLYDVPTEKHDAFLNWAISGEPIRSEVKKQDLIYAIKELFSIMGHDIMGRDG